MLLDADELLALPFLGQRRALAQSSHTSVVESSACASVRVGVRVGVKVRVGVRVRVRVRVGSRVRGR